MTQISNPDSYQNYHHRQLWQVLDLIRWGTRYFTTHNISNARLETEWLLAHQLHLERVDLYVQHDRALTPEELAGFKELVRRRAAGEPFQYILGKAPFYGRDFRVSPGVMIPRPETEVLIQVLRRGPAPDSILDIGTGSGCLAVTAGLLYPGAQVLAMDFSEIALEIARENARRLGASNITFQQREVFRQPLKGKFDVILCNPPYVPAAEWPALQREIRQYEPEAALTDGADGMTWFRWLAKIAPGLLNPGDPRPDVSGSGRLIVEIGGASQARPVQAIFEAAGIQVTLHADLQQEPRVCEGRWAGGSISRREGF